MPVGKEGGGKFLKKQLYVYMALHMERLQNKTKENLPEFGPVFFTVINFAVSLHSHTISFSFTFSFFDTALATKLGPIC